jgi:hypothetical protein
MPDTQSNRRRLKTWWIAWAAVLSSLIVLYLAFGRGPLPATGSTKANPLADLVGVVPLFLSIIIRWLVLPRYHELSRAFVLFVFGLSFAESCGILGLFLGGPYRDYLVVLGLLGIAQFMPFFAKKYLEPKVTGFIPNN